MSRPRKYPAHLKAKSRKEAKRRAEMKRRKSGRKTQPKRAQLTPLDDMLRKLWLYEKLGLPLPPIGKY